MSHIVGKFQQYLHVHPVGNEPIGLKFHMSPLCSLQVIVQAEFECGFRLPEPLKDTYTTIANGGFGLGYGAMRARTSMAHTNGTTGEQSHRMLKKTTFSPAQPRRAKTRRSTGKAAASNQRWFFQACSCTLPRMARMSPPLRAFFQFPITFSRVAWSILDCARRTSTFLSCAFREQEDDQAALTIFLRPRVARAQGTHRAIPPCWRAFSASCDVRPGGVREDGGARVRDRTDQG